MKMVTTALVVLCVILLHGCATYQDATRKHLSRISTGDPLNHLSYEYSDDLYHYIRHCKLLDGGRYRIKKSDLQVRREFKKGEGEPYLIMVLSELQRSQLKSSATHTLPTEMTVEGYRIPKQ
jgi:hypothetical protein